MDYKLKKEEEEISHFLNVLHEDGKTEEFKGRESIGNGKSTCKSKSEWSVKSHSMLEDERSLFI